MCRKIPFWCFTLAVCAISHTVLGYAADPGASVAVQLLREGFHRQIETRIEIDADGPIVDWFKSLGGQNEPLNQAQYMVAISFNIPRSIFVDPDDPAVKRMQSHSTRPVTCGRFCKVHSITIEPTDCQDSQVEASDSLQQKCTVNIEKPEYASGIAQQTRIQQEIQLDIEKFLKASRESAETAWVLQAILPFHLRYALPCDGDCLGSRSFTIPLPELKLEVKIFDGKTIKTTRALPPAVIPNGRSLVVDVPVGNLQDLAFVQKVSAGFCLLMVSITGFVMQSSIEV